MKWTSLPFGKYKFQTLPNVVLHDPDWFFWAVDNNAFHPYLLLKHQVADLLRKSRNIRVPIIDDTQHSVEHYIDMRSRKYSHFILVPANAPPHAGSSHTARRHVLDLSASRQLAPFDKLGSRNLLSCFRTYYFGGKSARIDSGRASDFFNKEENFATPVATREDASNR